MCHRMALVLRTGRMACCDTPVELDRPRRTERISQPPQRRCLLSQAERYEILRLQGHCCLYCDRTFGSTFVYRNRSTVLRLEWDHLVPWCHTQNNQPANYVAACHVCNGTKGDRIFATVDEVRVHVARKWEKIEAAQNRILPGMRDTLHCVPTGASLLRAKMPLQGVGKAAPEDDG